MKKIILVAWLSGIFIVSFAQDAKEPLATPYAMPIDTITKLVTYEAVVEMKGHDATTLYKRINDWFLGYYKNPQEVIRENDSIKHTVTGKPRFRLVLISAKDGTKNERSVVQYTITVAARDGRYKYTLTDFNWRQPSYYPVERWLDTKTAGYQPAYNDYLQQTDKTALEVIQSLKEAVSKEKPVKNKDAW